MNEPKPPLDVDAAMADARATMDMGLYGEVTGEVLAAHVLALGEALKQAQDEAKRLRDENEALLARARTAVAQASYIGQANLEAISDWGKKMIANHHEGCAHYEKQRDAARAEADALRAENAKLKQDIKNLTSGERTVRCPSCGDVTDLGPSLPEVSYEGDIEEVECDSCGCEFHAHAVAVTICFEGETP